MNIAAIVLQVLLGLAFLMSGFGKVSGQKMHVDNFVRYRHPQWLRVVTGLLQLVSVICIVIGFWTTSWAAVGGLLLTVIMLGAILTHIRIKDTMKNTFPAILLFILPLALLLLRWSELSQFPN